MTMVSVPSLFFVRVGCGRAVARSGSSSSAQSVRPGVLDMVKVVCVGVRMGECPYIIHLLKVVMYECRCLQPRRHSRTEPSPREFLWCQDFVIGEVGGWSISSPMWLNSI